MNALFVIVGVLVLAAVCIAFVVQRLIHICPPNAVLIFSGARRQVDGRAVGYRLVQGGRGLRIPLFERVDRMDLTNMIVDKGYIRCKDLHLMGEGDTLLLVEVIPLGNRRIARR